MGGGGRKIATQLSGRDPAWQGVPDTAPAFAIKNPPVEGDVKDGSLTAAANQSRQYQLRWTRNLIQHKATSQKDVKL